jgi:hypothetical protein
VPEHIFYDEIIAVAIKPIRVEERCPVCQGRLGLYSASPVESPFHLTEDGKGWLGSIGPRRDQMRFIEVGRCIEPLDLQWASTIVKGLVATYPDL